MLSCTFSRRENVRLFSLCTTLRSEKRKESFDGTPWPNKWTGLASECFVQSRSSRAVAPAPSRRTLCLLSVFHLSCPTHSTYTLSLTSWNKSPPGKPQIEKYPTRSDMQEDFFLYFFLTYCSWPALFLLFLTKNVHSSTDKKRK